jgi:hypothetical protein
MADAKYSVLKISFEFLEHSTDVEVVCSETDDGTLGVGGVHKKSFPTNRDAVSIIREEILRQDYLLW